VYIKQEEFRDDKLRGGSQMTAKEGKGLRYSGKGSSRGKALLGDEKAKKQADSTGKKWIHQT